MSFRLVQSTRLGLQPTATRLLYTPKNFIRLSSSSTSNQPPANDSIEKPSTTTSENSHHSSGAIDETKTNKLEEETPVQKSLAATRAYLEKVQSDFKPRLEPYINKLNNASEQLKRLTTDVSDSKEALQRASRALNELTGYDQIDAVKQKVNNQALLFENTRDQVQEAKLAYETAIETRSSTQRGINELLQRKHLWTGDDVTKFTELYRLEHSHSQAESLAKEKYQACEKQMDREYMELARSIMERYHEEQLWSDKIRKVSTYGTWALMVVNLVLFVTVQTIFEPRKRKRLTDRFEELLVAKVDEEEEKFKHVFESLDEKDKLLMAQQVAVMETLNSLVEHPLFDQETLSSLKQHSTPVSASASAPAPAVVMKEDDDIPQFTEPLLSYADTKCEEIQLNNEELGKLLLLSSSVDHERPTLISTTAAAATANTKDTLTISKSNLVLYSIESALAGGLVTALAVYFFR